MAGIHYPHNDNGTLRCICGETHDEPVAPALASMTRSELDHLAVSVGIEDPASFPNKAALIGSIEERRTA